MTETKPDDFDAEMARYSWEAYRGLLLGRESEADEWIASECAGLVYETVGEHGDTATPKGARVLTRLHRVLDGLDSRVLDLLGGAPWDGPGRSDAEDTLVESGALSCACGPCSHESCTLDITNVGRALLLLREHGKDGT